MSDGFYVIICICFIYGCALFISQQEKGEKRNHRKKNSEPLSSDKIVQGTALINGKEIKVPTLESEPRRVPRRISEVISTDEEKPKELEGAYLNEHMNSVINQN